MTDSPARVLQGKKERGSTVRQGGDGYRSKARNKLAPGLQGEMGRKLDKKDVGNKQRAA